MRCTVGRRKPSSRRASPTRMADRRPSSRASASRTSRRPRPVSDDFGFLLLLLSNGIMIGLSAMVAFGFALERIMLRRLIGRPVIAVVMATIGLASILRGVGPATVGAGTRTLPLPIPDEPIVVGPLFIPPIQLLGALVSLAFLGGFGWFFLKSRKGIAMRAIADNQQVAMAMGINVERYFGLAWAMTGVVSAIGGILWGNLIGVDVNIALVGFKVFPE